MSRDVVTISVAIVGLPETGLPYVFGQIAHDPMPERTREQTSVRVASGGDLAAAIVECLALLRPIAEAYQDMAAQSIDLLDCSPPDDPVVYFDGRLNTELN